MGLACLVLLIVPGVACCQQLSTSVYPTEDELREALFLGEIDYDHYLVLCETVAEGVPSGHGYLFDEIPNLDYFLRDSSALISELESEQAAAFARQTQAWRTHGSLAHGYAREMVGAGRSRYRTSLVLQPTDNVSGQLRLYREFSGRERFAQRFIEYEPDSSAVRRLIAGNFSTRLGLGTVIGYHGKPFNFEDRISSESFLCPDYGGFNGLLLEAGSQSNQITALASLQRDTAVSLVIGGGMVRHRHGAGQLGLIAVAHRLRNRMDSRSLGFAAVALTNLWQYRSGYQQVEVGAQSRATSRSISAVIEGRHRFREAELRYAGWAYGDGMIDLAAGSKAGNMRRQRYLDQVGLTYSDRRSGQEGLLFKSMVILPGRIQFSNGFIYAGRNRDTSDVEVLSAVERKIARRTSLRIDYQRRSHLRRTAVQKQPAVRDRLRIEGRLTSGLLSLRSFVAYTVSSTDGDFVSVFTRLTVRTAETGEWQVWTNAGRIVGGRLDYWYGYLRHEVDLTRNLTSVMKFALRYDRGSSREYLPQVSVEMRTTW